MNVGLERSKGATSFKVGPTSLALGVTPRDTVASLYPHFCPHVQLSFHAFFAFFESS